MFEPRLRAVLISYIPGTLIIPPTRHLPYGSSKLKVCQYAITRELLQTVFFIFFSIFAVSD